MPQERMSQIVVEDLVKTFQVAERQPGLWGAVRGVVRRRVRTVEALAGVGFAIEPGELVGYVGPNGAGKSTTIKILSGILVPDSGRCDVLGFVPWKQRAEYVSQIGVVFGQRTQLWWDLPVVESFELLRHIYRVPEEAHRSVRDELIAMLELEPLLDTPVRQLSLGQRMRCDVAASLLHAPPLLFLDEPTIGLDATAKLADQLLRLDQPQAGERRGLGGLVVAREFFCARDIGGFESPRLAQPCAQRFARERAVDRYQSAFEHAEDLARAAALQPELTGRLLAHELE